MKMKTIIIIAIVLTISQCFSLNMNTEDFGGIDYLPATQAFTKIKVVQSEYENFRSKIAKKFIYFF